MKKFKPLAINSIILITALLLFTYSCTNSAGKKEKMPSVNCPIIIGPLSAQFMVSFETAYKLFNERVEYVSVIETEPPAVARDNFGNIYETIGGSESDDMIMVVKADDKYTHTDNCQILMCKGIGEYSAWFAKACSKFYYKNSNDSIVKIGFEEMQYRNTPSGGKVLMTKGINDKNWYGNAWGKVYKDSADINAQQIGVFSFFNISLNDSISISRSIVMTKGLNPNDKWCGELDGIIYIQK